MHFYATSAQIAEDFGTDYDAVISVIENLDVSDDFRRSHIQMFDLRGIQLAQVTEPGYNAIVMHLPVDETDGTDGVTENAQLLMKWREQFYMNRAPDVATLTNVSTIQPSQAAINIASVTPRRASTDENARRRAEELINTGTYDQFIAASFADVHRKIMGDLNGDDPGYQNVRQYVLARRSAIGLNI